MYVANVSFVISFFGKQLLLYIITYLKKLYQETLGKLCSRM